MSPAWNASGLRLTVLRGRNPQVRDLPQTDHFAAMMDHLAECAATGSTPLTPGEDGLNDMRAIEAIYESVRTNRPVSLA
jgi:glucose-fructose oxidoreductase